MGLQNEIDALHRIAHAEGDLGGHMPAGMWEFDRFFTIEIDEEAIYAEVDFYSQRIAADGPPFDSDTWEREKLRLRVTPKNREGFYLTHALVRGLLSGRSAAFADGVILDRNSYLEQVKSAGTDLTILTLQLNVGA